MTNKLFRKESLEGAYVKVAGEVIIGQNIGFRVFGYISAAIVLLLLVFVSLAEYPRKETVTGWLTPHGGIIRSAARSGGTIEAILVQEGQVVRAGETLAALRLSLDTQDGDAGVALERSVRAEMGATDLGALVQVQKLRAEAAQLAERQKLLQSQRAELLANVATLSDIQSVAKDDYNRGTGLRDKGFMAQSALDQKKTALLVAQNDLSSGRNSLNAVDQQLAQVRSEIHAMPLLLAQAESQSRSNNAALQQKLEQARAQSRYTLTAPIDGKVMAVPVEIGQTLTAGATVIVITPGSTRLEAELLVPSRSAGFVKVGQEVSLQYSAFPYQKFGSGKGRIISVSKTVLASGEINIPGLTLQEPVFRVRVALEKDHVSAYGEKMPLQPGMLMTADIIIDRRSLLEWLLDPLYAVSRR